ncbi:MAG: diadenylate cyclase CdaA [Clostridia bacterium]|jgi:diadenylate cyclase|nr:diadenylate cyclase CdaA [Clostridia bacterium]MCI1999347.1 diadenylate cyclase CdaA [Clostridia bacterium]MCI2015151.1 diadenylate cyclase CdaA [Clostridia bacterium]
MDFFLRGLFSNFRYTDIIIPSIGIRDILDILIVAYIIYKIFCLMKETRAWTLFKGIAVICVFAIACMILNLNTMVWILSNTLSVGIMALIVVFQPELRKALEQLGKGKHFTDFFSLGENQHVGNFSEKTMEEIIKASEKMSAARTGALMLIEREVPLGDFERTGIQIDAVVTNQLLINIFEHNTPLHDGAVIIKNNRVAAATCFLPLTESNDISMELGTRHRAGIGASEVSDAYAVIVSEETGAISLASNGVLYRNLSTETLRSMLSQGSTVGRIKKRFFLRRHRGKDE